jgi:hypothetical protein
VGTNGILEFRFLSKNAHCTKCVAFKTGHRGLGTTATCRKALLSRSCAATAVKAAKAAVVSAGQVSSDRADSDKFCVLPFGVATEFMVSPVRECTPERNAIRPHTHVSFKLTGARDPKCIQSNNTSWWKSEHCATATRCPPTSTCVCFSTCSTLRPAGTGREEESGIQIA